MNLCKTGILSLYHVFGSQKMVEHLLQKNWCVSTETQRDINMTASSIFAMQLPPFK